MAEKKTKQMEGMTLQIIAMICYARLEFNNKPRKGSAMEFFDTITTTHAQDCEVILKGIKMVHPDIKKPKRKELMEFMNKNRM